MSSSSIRSYSRGASSSSNMSLSENLPPRTLARVAREVRDLLKKAPEGTRIVVDADTGLPANLGEITAEIEGPEGTPYSGRHFQLKLVLSGDFPNSPPKGFFLTKIYHPNVDISTGAICVNTLKKDWDTNVTLSHVLSVIRCLLIVPFPESSLNDEAGKLFMESYDEYARRAKLMADVHGKLSPPSSPGKNSKENDIGFDHMNCNNVKLSSSTTGAVLKQSNSMDRKCDGKSAPVPVTKSSKSKSGLLKKNKKKSLKRL
jgi:ubiquitin-conjugating enzyme E2 S